MSGCQQLICHNKIIKNVLLNFYLKVHPNIELEGLVVQMLDASGHAADGDAKLVADEGGGGAISVRGLHQAQLELSLQPRLK